MEAQNKTIELDHDLTATGRTKKGLEEKETKETNNMIIPNIAKEHAENCQSDLVSLSKDTIDSSKNGVDDDLKDF
jgi:hypothetical protein